MGIMSKTTAAYIAGFIDGEGTITIKRTHIKESRCYDVNLSVSNTNKDIIQWLQDSYGGTFHISTYGNDKWKTIYRWTLYRSHNLIGFLQTIKPYLRIKKRHAEIVLEMNKFLGHGFVTYKRNEKGQIIEHFVNDDIRKKREELYQEIKILNHRGVLHGERLSEVTPIGDAI